MDCIGKTVQATFVQFPSIYALLQELATRFALVCPPLFIYEDFYYGADVQGCATPWIEVSSKTVQDFSQNELAFVLARQLARIQLGHLRTRITLDLFDQLAQGRLGAVLGSVSLGLSPVALSSLRLSGNKWSRLSNIAMDCAAFLAVGNLDTAFKAILLEVLNSRRLADEVNIGAFLKQSEEMDSKTDVFSTLAHYEQNVPYAPYRIKELLRFASSERAKAALSGRGLVSQITNELAPAPSGIMGSSPRKGLFFA